MNDNRVLILGATGGIGSELAKQLVNDGWNVSALSRHPKLSERTAITYKHGDAMDAQAVVDAAQNVNVIFHGVNPVGYKNWAGLALPMLKNTLAAAKANHATVVLPGTVYNYGPDSFPLIKEDSPQHPKTRKGAIRVQMEQLLAEYAASGGQVIIIRAGDFFGASAKNTWFTQLVKPGRAITKIVQLGNVGHQWAYLPDLAKTMARVLAKRAQLPTFSNFHFAGYWDYDGKQLINAIADIAFQDRGKRPKLGHFPWWLVPSLGLFNETIYEVAEMRYLWQESVRMDNHQLLELLGTEPHTPLRQAIEQTLSGLGCLSQINQSKA